MSNTDPGVPRSPIDTLLMEPEKQGAIRNFFANVDASWEQYRRQGFHIDTVQARSVAHYPAVITDNGLLFELYSTERSIAPGPDIDITQATQDDVIKSAFHLMAYETKVKAALIDLNRDPNFVTLNVYNTKWNRLDAVIKPGQMYREGCGSVMMFGHQKDAPIKDPAVALLTISKAAAGLADEETAQAYAQAMNELAEQGAYFLIVNFHSLKNSEGDSVWRHASTGALKSEAFPAARTRVGFEL